MANCRKWIRYVCAGKIPVYSGDDATAADLMLMGVQGNIFVTANVATGKSSMISHLQALENNPGIKRRAAITFVKNP